MTTPHPAGAPTDIYLRKVRRALASLPPAEQEDIIAELRSHVLERQAQGSTDPLAGFEAPEQLAADLVAEYALRGALAQGTAWALGRALFVAGRDSILGLVLLLPLLVLQLFAVGLLVVAALKPFLPDHVGWWTGGGRFQIGYVSDHGTMTELLGWWAIPVFVGAGVLLFWLPNRAMMALTRWRLRSVQPARA